MSKINAEYSAEHYFAALKLIEQLYKDGLISAQMLRSILNDHADVVDLSKFTIMEEKEEASPLQYSCLKNPMDRGAWRATVQGVTKSQT